MKKIVLFVKGFTGIIYILCIALGIVYVSNNYINTDYQKELKIQKYEERLSAKDKEITKLNKEINNLTELKESLEKENKDVYTQLNSKKEKDASNKKENKTKESEDKESKTKESKDKDNEDDSTDGVFIFIFIILLIMVMLW